jgi:tetratricopeptide (TPR) repeat protein
VPQAAEIPAQHQELLPDEELTALPLPEHGQVAAEGPEPALELPQAALPKPLPPEPEFELEQDFELVIEPEPVLPAHEMLEQAPALPKKEEAAKSPAPVKPETKEKVPAGMPSNGNAFSAEDFLSDLAKEIDQLGMGELTPPAVEPDHGAPAAKKEELAAANAGMDAESAPLREVFEEFRAELGEMGAEDEDLETHYNLGIAFREMGLLEEAIGEFQKVAKANDRGKAFRYAMQCCTLLGLAFMEKGQPSIAAIWYERALQTPGIDAESKLALRYDLGVAQESAGDLDLALKSFSQVYAVNIDYRDVAERITALQKPAR